MAWIGSGTLSQVMVAESIMQQKIPTLTVQGPIDTNQVLKKLNDLKP